MIVIGVGAAMRSDDGVGPAAVASIATSPLGSRPDVELAVQDGEPSRLIDAWMNRDRAIVIDAVRTGEPPGSIHRLEIGRDPIPPAVAGPSSHARGVADAVLLAEALGRLPAELVILGVEPADLSPGEGLTPAVQAVLPELVARVVAEVGP